MLLTVLVCFVFLNFVAANGGDDVVNITTPGCSDPITPAGQCSVDGNFYCSDGGDAWDVLNVPNACYNGSGSGSGTCCPHGYDCVQESGDFLCKLQTTDCSDFGESECEADNGFGLPNNCYWDGASCIYPPRTCGDYTTLNDCNNDSLTERAAQGECISEAWIDADGTFYVVPIESCHCEWKTDICELSYTITSTLEDETYACNKQYDYSDCTDGVQPYSIIAEMVPDTNPALKAAFDCESDAGQRICGVKLVQVPFFTWTNLVLAIILISAFYLIKIRKTKKKK